MLAREIMTPIVISIETDAPVMRAVHLMLQFRISGLPVVGLKGDLVGMVTEGDLLRHREIGSQRHRSRWLETLIGPRRLADEYVHVSSHRIEEVMTREPITVAEDTPFKKLVQIMEQHQIKRVPVVQDGRLAGIITRANIMHALVSSALETNVSAGTYASISTQVLAEYKKRSSTPRINAVAHDGVVELWGTIADDRERQNLIAAAESVPGVKVVHNHLVWIEPNSGFVVQSK